MRFTIFQKGLLLISLPLACEIAFVCFLIHLLGATQTELRKETHAREVISHVDQIRRFCTQGAFMATAAASSKEPLMRPALWAEYVKCENAVDYHLGKAMELCKDNNEQIKALDSIAQNDALGRQMLNRIQSSKDPLNDLLPYESMATLDHPFVQIRVNADRIVAQEERIVKGSSDSRVAMLDQIGATLYTAIGFNVLLTVALTGFFARNITGRLRFVMDNTRRMVRRENLNPQVGGSDEIAELDGTIHRTADELNELEKFKRELTAMVTHELRTPLTSVQGVLSLLKLGALGELSALAKSNVEMAESNTQRLIKLINDLLDIEKMEAGKLELMYAPVLLNDIIQQSLTAVKAFGDQYGVQLQTSIVDCYVTADGDWIQQVVINLVSNAIKYSPKGGIVRIETHLHPTTAEVRVIDHGRGIPPEFRDRVFDKFQQVDARDPREKKGTGLGLAICKGIIEQHRGAIGVESEMGVGSQFWFTLPLAQESAASHDDRSCVAPNLQNT